MTLIPCKCGVSHRVEDVSDLSIWWDDDRRPTMVQYLCPKILPGLQSHMTVEWEHASPDLRRRAVDADEARYREGA